MVQQNSRVPARGPALTTRQAQATLVELGSNGWDQRQRSVNTEHTGGTDVTWSNMKQAKGPGRTWGVRSLLRRDI